MVILFSLPIIFLIYGSLFIVIITVYCYLRNVLQKITVQNIKILHSVSGILRTLFKSYVKKYRVGSGLM